MAKSTNKRIPKPPSKPPSKPPPSSPPRYPFHPPSPALASFLSTFPQEHIYILHVDSFPAQHKRGIFLVPLTLNILLAALLLWRLLAALPTYMAILAATLGLDSSAGIDVGSASWATLVEIGARRTVMFFLDFTLATFVLGWPRDFFYWGDPPGPARWRWNAGFGEREVVVRRSRRWGEEVVGREAEVTGEREVGERVYRERVLPAVEPGWVHGRTGYAMMDKSWDLDFKGMLTAHHVLAAKYLSLADFALQVAVHTPDRGWLVWEIATPSAAGGGPAEGLVPRNQMERIKASLGALGKETLFVRWVELMQAETAGQEGLTPERKAGILTKVEDMFRAEGMAFEEFWGEVGGTDGHGMFGL